MRAYWTVYIKCSIIGEYFPLCSVLSAPLATSPPASCASTLHSLHTEAPVSHRIRCTPPPRRASGPCVCVGPTLPIAFSLPERRILFMPRDISHLNLSLTVIPSPGASLTAPQTSSLVSHRRKPVLGSTPPPPPSSFNRISNSASF